MRHDALFPSDNELGIPLLLEEHQAEWIEAPCRAWGSCGRTRIHQGTWHFYSEDYRWSNLWACPWQVTDTQPIVCVEPNYSIQDETPPALAIASIHKKRWLARYWQSRGVRIFVDLYVPAHHQDWNLLGVPRGWKAYATRGGDREIDGLIHDYETACHHAGTDAIVFAAFGGGPRVAEWCRDHRAMHVPYRAKRNAYSVAVQESTSPCKGGA